MDLFVVDDLIEDFDLREEAVLGESMLFVYIVCLICCCSLELFYRMVTMWLSVAI